MNNLYVNHPEIYDMMYQTFINYDEEYTYYNNKLKKYTVESIVELGCGTGNLAKRLYANGFKYTGIDLNKAMLTVAENKNPGVDFIEADMRSFNLLEKKQACIIAGRTISYLITYQDVIDSLKSIHANLQEGGIICFDNIDARKFIPDIKNGKKIIHSAEFDGKKFHRESYWSVNGAQTWAFNWDSAYFEEAKDGVMVKIAEDNSTVRCFTKDDLCLFLELANFDIKEIEERPSYTFDTFVMVAQKK